MKKLLLLIITSLTLALMTGLSYAAELKIGIINLNQILQKSPLMISLNDDLVKQFKPRQDELVNAQKQLQDENNKLTINGATMSNDERSKLQNKIIADQANVQILTASLQRDVAIAKDAALQKFMAKLNDVITKIAKDGNYDLIEQNSNFAFINGKLDITQQVLQEIK
ncbi:MAG: OmpH/Skp family outer membrane protein [Gammaproteobacteria bacterium]